ncbi:MAG TPA: N-acetylmuramoyl-L-alanine amidase [Allosphingosinicella sp.]|nr:N-acetylmuramoyl-L-alanine amidase [Allosphingosinicella sp.]
MANLGAIVLDPGHGGTTIVGGSSPNNAKSVSGVLEKNLALDFCKILKAELERQASASGDTVDVFLTRTTDVNVGIADRAKLAKTKNAKLFLSLHFNGLDDASVRGAETFFATRGNGNPNEAVDKAFATKMQAALMAGLKAVDPTSKDRGVKPDTDSQPRRLGTLSGVARDNAGRPNKCLAAYYELEFISNQQVEKVLISGPGAAANRVKVMGSVAKAMLDQVRTMP